MFLADRVEGNQYFPWIENYVSDDFSAAVRVGKELLEENAVNLSSARIEEIVEIFREGTRLEVLFWEMGLSHYRKIAARK